MRAWLCRPGAFGLIVTKELDDDESEPSEADGVVLKLSTMAHLLCERTLTLRARRVDNQIRIASTPVGL